MTEFGEEDIHELRRQGDLRAFLRGLIRPTVRAEQPAAAPRVQRGAGERPVGAWPAGTRPSARPEHPPDAWSAALAEYRTDPTARDRPCGCGAHIEEDE